MQTLAAGAVGLAIALVFAITAGSGEEATAASIFVQVLALISAPLFLLGFAPPPFRVEAKILLFTAFDLATQAAAEPAIDAFLSKTQIDLLLPTVQRLLEMNPAA